MSPAHQWIDDDGAGVASPTGYAAAGVASGIKRATSSGEAPSPDLALVVSSGGPAAAAAVFTTNRMAAAPVRLSRERIASGRARAILLNSGNANACTGSRGLADAERSATAAATAVGCPVEEVLVASTGPIGVPLPMDRVLAGIEAAGKRLSGDGSAAAAEAILTTDTRPKRCAARVSDGEPPYLVGAMAKGAGMIRPDMATMLAVVTTDASVDAPALQTALRAAVAESFNRITIDDDQSTNDTVFVLANGASGVRRTPDAPGWEGFTEALTAVCRRLAREIVADGEGTTRVVTVRVTGARSVRDADRVARAVAGSQLVKCSWFGGDPNWGRILDAVGYAGADVDPERVGVWFDDLRVAVDGGADPAASGECARRIVAAPEFTVRVDLALGDGTAEILTTDLTHEYVRINAEH